MRAQHVVEVIREAGLDRGNSRFTPIGLDDFSPKVDERDCDDLPPQGKAATCYYYLESIIEIRAYFLREFVAGSRGEALLLTPGQLS